MAPRHTNNGMEKDKFILTAIVIFILISTFYVALPLLDVISIETGNSAKNPASNPGIAPEFQEAKNPDDVPETLPPGSDDASASPAEQEASPVEKATASGGSGGRVDEGLRQIIESRPAEKSEVIFHVPENQNLDEVSEKILQAGGEVSGAYSIGNMVIAKVPNSKIESLVSGTSVTKAWPEREVQVMDENSSAQINSQQAWSAGYNGSGVKVAVLDTGIDSSHEMLKGKVILEKDFTGDSPEDVFGHGTHVAGIIAGNGNYKGVASGALLLNAKVLNDKGSGRDIDVIRAINWAVDPDGNPDTDDGADIISMSLGGLYSDPFGPLSLAVKGAIERGVIVVAASGNCGPCGNCGGFKGVTTPGSSPYAITVGAVDENGQYACFSSGEAIKNVGIKPDVVAPGKNILSSVPNGYATKSGTSMSTPHIAGAAALLLQMKPDMNHEGVKQILESFSADLGVPGKDVQYGSGLPDIGRISYLRVIPEPAVIEYSNSSMGFKIWNFAGKNITIRNITCKNCSVSFTTETVVENGKYAPFNLIAGEFAANLPVHVETDSMNATVIITKLFEKGPEITYEYWNSTIRPLIENDTINSNISALVISKVYCDWADNGGNSYCRYWGRWKDLASRGKLGMKRGEMYYVEGDTIPGGVIRDGKEGKYEEEDAYATVGSVSGDADLTKINVNYAAGAMNKNGGFGDWWDSVYDVTNINVICNGKDVVNKDPCWFWCNNFQDSTACAPAKNEKYRIDVWAKINTKNAYNEIVVVTINDTDYLDFKCVKDSDCSGNGKCAINSNGRGTHCEFTDECANGAVECASATKKRTCGDYDGNGYTEWSAPATCSPVAACHPSNCVSSLKDCPNCDLSAGNNYIKWTAQSASRDAAFASISGKLQETLYIGADDKWASNPATVVNGGIYILKMSSSGALTYEYCGDSICNNGETMDSCSDCGKKHSYNKFPGGWSADISSFDTQAYFGKDYSLKINYKCSSDGYVYFPLDLAKDSSGKFTCGDPPHDTGCQNEVLVKSYFSGSDCNSQWKERTLTFKIPSGSNPGQHNLWIGYWHGYDSGITPKIDGSDGGYHSSSGPKTIAVSEWKCTSNSQCSSDEYCSSEGTCKKDVCAPQGQNYCKNNDVYACSSDGSSESLIKSCSSDEVCQSASCVPKIVCGNNKCEAGETTSCPKDCPSPCNDYCVGDTSYFDGKWIDSKCSYSSGLCAYGCFNGKCLAQTEFPFKMSIESAQEKITVYKQPGDYVTIAFSSTKAQAIDFSPPSVLTYVSGPYSGGKANLASGKTSVTFQIDESAKGNHPITASNAYTKTPILWLSIINEPEFLIITDKQALMQRFPAEEAKVSTLLQEAYSLAGKYGTAVVYDLSDYKSILGNRPWVKFGDYNEKPLEPEIKDNTYVSSVAEFIQKKCKNCKNVMILGDDFVVPMYRVDFKWLNQHWLDIFGWWARPETKFIYSDTAYIPRDVKPLGDLNAILESIRQDKGEKVVIIKPDGRNYPELDKLKSVLTSSSYPYKIKSYNIAEYESRNIACNEYGKLKGHTLIIIGDRNSNNAVKCVPWFDAGKKPGDTFKASITLERNVWSDKSDYAVILSGDENNAISVLADFLENPNYYTNNFMKTSQTVYIHEFSKPQNVITGGDYFKGFVLGKCEHVGESFIEQSPCIASDVTVSFLPGIGAVTDIRDAAIYCTMMVFSGENMDRILCGVGLGGAATSIGTVVALPTVVGSAASEAADVTLATAKGILKTLKAAMKSSAAFEKIAKTLKLTDAESIKKFFRLDSGEGIEVAQKRFKDILTGPYRKSALNALAELDESALKAGIKNADDLENAVKGSEAILSRFKSLEDFAPTLKGCLKSVSLIVTAGVCSPEEYAKIIEKLKGIGKIDVSKLSHGQETLDEAVKVLSKTQLKWSNDAIQRMTSFIDESVEVTQTGKVFEGSKVLQSLQSIKGEKFAQNIFEDSNKVVKKIPESNMPNVKTPDFQIDNIILEAKTLESGDYIVDASTTAFKNNFDKAAEQLEEAHKIVNNPQKIIHIDASVRNFIPNNPTQFIDAGSNTGLQKLWNDAKNAGRGIEELWLKLKDSSGIDRLWRLYEENGVLKGAMIE